MRFLLRNLLAICMIIDGLVMIITLTSYMSHCGVWAATALAKHNGGIPLNRIFKKWSP